MELKNHNMNDFIILEIHEKKEQIKFRNYKIQSFISSFYFSTITKLKKIIVIIKKSYIIRKFGRHQISQNNSEKLAVIVQILIKILLKQCFVY